MVGVILILLVFYLEKLPEGYVLRTFSNSEISIGALVRTNAFLLIYANFLLVTSPFIDTVYKIYMKVTASTFKTKWVIIENRLTD